jgi:hypothetical protein
MVNNNTQAMIIADQLTMLDSETLTLVAHLIVANNQQKAGNLEFALSVASHELMLSRNAEIVSA